MAPLVEHFLGGSDEDWSSEIVVDLSGNVYVIGCSGMTLVYDGGWIRLRGPASAFVTKLDTNGTLLWNTLLGGQI